MTNSDELRSFDVAELAEKFQAHELSPVEVTDAYLARIEQTEARLHAYITVTSELARTSARQAEAEIMAGRWRGPFHGVPRGFERSLQHQRYPDHQCLPGACR